MLSNPKGLTHTPMTDPGGFRRQIEALPGDVASFARVAQGLILHGDCLALYGLDAAALGPTSRTTLPVRERLGRLVSRDNLDLAQARIPARREIGTCRDFALLLTSLLRTHGVPARCRCGFAAYLGPSWEDHWVCEYGSDGGLSLADAQIDGAQREAREISFDTLRVPRAAFLPADEAWRAVRSGRLSPDRFGHGETRGLWFMSVNVARDNLSVNGQETSAWDAWREAAPNRRVLSEADLARCDEIALDPERLACAAAPPWLDAA